VLPVVIKQISAEGRVLPLGSSVNLAPGNSRLEVSYAAIHLGPQESIRYRFKMDGLEQWSSESEQRTASYTHIPAGKYVFRVQAFAIDNPDAISEAAVVVEQEPHFYATSWFFVCCIMLALTIAILIYRLRVRQIKMRFRAVSEERARVAREMHDTVIQGCVGVSTLLEAALGVESSEESLRVQLLTYASDQVTATIEAARESVWALRNSSESNTDVGSLCERLAREFQSTSSIPIQRYVSGQSFLLGDSATHELMMAIREVVTNALIHANALHIDLEVVFNESEVTVTVRDDGCGFDLNAARSQKGHFGITGIQERVQLLGGDMTIVSDVTHGTVVSIVVPRRPRMAERKEIVHVG
jgi:signal transduction histidine kinase